MEYLSLFVKHFKEAKSGQTRRENNKCTYEGLKKKITPAEFLINVRLIFDAFNELS